MAPCSDVAPLNLDGLGIVVPASSTRIELTFGTHRVLVAVAWAVSMLVLVTAFGAQAASRPLRRKPAAG